MIIFGGPGDRCWHSWAKVPTTPNMYVCVYCLESGWKV